MSIVIKGMEMPKSRPICVVIDAAGQARRYDLNNDRYTDKELFEAADAIEELKRLAPVVRCSECKYNEHCFTQSFVRDEGIVPFDPDTWFCADGKRTDGGAIYES